MGLRLWSAHFIRKSLKMPDYWVIIAYVSTTIFAGLTWWGIANGLGRHTADLSVREVRVQWRLQFAGGILWLTSSVGCKLSILTLYFSLFNTSRRFSIIIYIACGITLIYFMIFLPMFITLCHPITQGWKPVPGGSCKSPVPLEIASITLNIFSDTLIAVLRIPMLWRLRIPLYRKVTIGAMFLMGLVVVATMIWRLQVTVSPSTQGDFAYGLGRIALTCFLELWLSIIVVSLPTLAPLFRLFIEPLLRRKRASNRIQLQLAAYSIGSGPRKRREDILKPGERGRFWCWLAFSWRFLPDTTASVSLGRSSHLISFRPGDVPY
ncbi:hypothetical protein BDV10DRAFT_197618 [Aspergillus recurvatus]